LIAQSLATGLQVSDNKLVADRPREQPQEAYCVGTIQKIADTA
jgi:hypothetical protein